MKERMENSFNTLNLKSQERLGNQLSEKKESEKEDKDRANLKRKLITEEDTVGKREIAKKSKKLISDNDRNTPQACSSSQIEQPCSNKQLPTSFKRLKEAVYTENESKKKSKSLITDNSDEIPELCSSLENVTSETDKEQPTCSKRTTSDCYFFSESKVFDDTAEELSASSANDFKWQKTYNSDENLDARNSAAISCSEEQPTCLRRRRPSEGYSSEESDSDVKEFSNSMWNEIIQKLKEFSDGLDLMKQGNTDKKNCFIDEYENEISERENRNFNSQLDRLENDLRILEYEQSKKMKEFQDLISTFNDVFFQSIRKTIPMPEIENLIKNKILTEFETSKESKYFSTTVVLEINQYRECRWKRSSPEKEILDVINQVVSAITSLEFKIPDNLISQGIMHTYRNSNLQTSSLSNEGNDLFLNNSAYLSRRFNSLLREISADICQNISKYFSYRYFYAFGIDDFLDNMKRQFN